MSIESYLYPALSILLFLLLSSSIDAQRRYKRLRSRYDRQRKDGRPGYRWFALLLPFGLFHLRIAFGLIMILCTWRYGKHLAKHRKEVVFQQFAYRAYRYLNMQLNAGVRLEDALGRLHLMTPHRGLQAEVSEFTGTYLRNYHLDQAMEVLSHYEDSYLLKNALRRFDVEGGGGLYRQEEKLMFEKYLTGLRLGYKNRRQQMVFVGIVYLGLLVILILIPILFDMMMATQLLFT